MTGYEIAVGHCWSCGHIFTFDADLVPSIPIDPETGSALDVDPAPDGLEAARARAIKQPICRTCIDKANANRRATGRALIDVLPGAYPDEGEL